MGHIKQARVIGTNKPRHPFKAKRPSRLMLGLFLSLMAHVGVLSFAPDMTQAMPQDPTKALSVRLVSLAAPSTPSRSVATPQAQYTPASAALKTPDISIAARPDAKRIIAKPTTGKAHHDAEKQTDRQQKHEQATHAHAHVQAKAKKADTQKAHENQAAQNAAAHSRDQGREDTSIIPVLTDADIIKQTPPKYPARAQRMGRQGTVLLHALVQEDGSAQTLKIVSSSGHKSLDASAMAAVKTWRFASVQKDGRHAGKAWVEVPVTFVLRQ